ncbi:MAG: hypothetical protein ACRCR4_12680 [Thiotrichaceae bacterium]
MFPSTFAIRAMMEGYGTDATSSISLTGARQVDSFVITEIDTLHLQTQMMVSGQGIPAGARIVSIDVVDPVLGQVTIDKASTETITGPITVTFYCVISDELLIKIRDNQVVPWVNAKTRQSFQGIKTETEYYDGTGSSILVLRRRPIVRLLAVSYTNVDSNFYYLTPTALQVIADEGVLKSKANFNESTYIPIFYKGTRNIRVTYEYGYEVCPAEVGDAIAMLVAEQALCHIGSKTGGGDLSTSGYSRTFGQSGKWTHERRRLAKMALALLRPYMTGTGA